MKLSATVVLAILISPIALAAQGGGASFSVAGPVIASGAQSGQQLTVLTIQPAATMCPVSLHAQHMADGSMVRVGNPSYHTIGQSLYLVLQDPKSSPIAKATVTIRGYSNKARVTQASKNDGSSDAVLKMTVAFRTLPSGAAAGNLRVPGVTAVTRIDLESVIYEDGSVASFTGQQACRVAPDPFMLVAGR